MDFLPPSIVFLFLAVLVPNLYCRNAREFSKANVLDWCCGVQGMLQATQLSGASPHILLSNSPSTWSSKGQNLSFCNEMSLLFTYCYVYPRCWARSPDSTGLISNDSFPGSRLLRQKLSECQTWILFPSLPDFIFYSWLPFMCFFFYILKSSWVK